MMPHPCKFCTYLGVSHREEGAVATVYLCSRDGGVTATTVTAQRDGVRVSNKEIPIPERESLARLVVSYMEAVSA